MISLAISPSTMIGRPPLCAGLTEAFLDGREDGADRPAVLENALGNVAASIAGIVGESLLAAISADSEKVRRPGIRPEPP